MKPPPAPTPEVLRAMERRQFLRSAAAGTALLALGGGLYRLAADDMTREAQAQARPDGRPRLPPGQRVIEALRPMGGAEGPGDARSFSLRVHGLVKTPLTLDYAALLKLQQVTETADVHCVTGWSMLGGAWKGVRISHLASLAGVAAEARHVILESHHGYTANVPLAEATRNDCLITYRLDGRPFGLPHGAPVRALIPDLYFWKSAKWITGVRFVRDDEPGYWETRGYHNHADPWREERYG